MNKRRQEQSVLLRLSLIFATAIVIISVITPIESASIGGGGGGANSERGQALSKSHFEFSLNLYRSLAGKEGAAAAAGKDEVDGGNLVFSPYSVNMVLSLLFLGTRSSSSTSSQFRQVLKYENMSYVDVHTAFKAIAENFDSSYYHSKVRSGNAVFVREGAAVSRTYVRAVREFYRAYIEAMDFRADGAKTVGVINEWVGEVSDGQIPALLDTPPGADTSLLLINVLSLESRWLHPFDPNETFDKGLFFLQNNERLEVPMMSGRFELPLGYSRELECRVLEVPFTQKRMSMFILLPDDPKDGIHKLEGNATSDNLKRLFSTLENEVVNVRLPRFKMSSDINVKEPLKSLGLVDVFNPSKADLSLMAPQAALSLTTIKHQATFEVNEQGARGSAATVATLANRVGTLGQEYFEVDHPFMFLVWDYYSGMILLMGRVLHPDVS